MRTLSRLFILPVILVFLGGCVTTMPKVLPPQEVIINVKSIDKAVEVAEEGKDELKEIPDGLGIPKYSNYVTLIDGVCYYDIWGNLSIFDSSCFVKDIILLNSRGIKKMLIYLNSGGGSGFAGLDYADAINEAIDKYGFDITIRASGIVASAAIPIFASANRRICTANTLFMIHKGKLFKFIAEETAKDLAAQKKMMDLIEERYVKILKKATTLTEKQIIDKTEFTTWFTAKEAKSWGLVDEIVGE